MKCKVRLTQEVELIVEGRDEEAIMDWLSQTTPEEAFELSKGMASTSYDEEILYKINSNVVAGYVIKEDE